MALMRRFDTVPVVSAHASWVVIDPSWWRLSPTSGL
jgi:hypothetical protein